MYAHTPPQTHPFWVWLAFMSRWLDLAFQLATYVSKAMTLADSASLVAAAEAKTKAMAAAAAAKAEEDAEAARMAEIKKKEAVNQLKVSYQVLLVLRLCVIA